MNSEEAPYDCKLHGAGLQAEIGKGNHVLYMASHFLELP